MKTRAVTRCRACGKRIRDHEPDLVLEDTRTGCKRWFHTRCGAAAYALAAERPALYVLTVRHVEEVAN